MIFLLYKKMTLQGLFIMTVNIEIIIENNLPFWRYKLTRLLRIMTLKCFLLIIATIFFNIMQLHSQLAYPAPSLYIGKIPPIQIGRPFGPAN